MRKPQGNDLLLGKAAGTTADIAFPRTLRDKHLYVCGGTGTGKSKMLEHLIRQDIKNWRKSKCGLILLDPHGSLYDNLINWLAWNKDYFRDVPVVPIDLRQDDWIVSYNVLRGRIANPAVLVDNITDAMAHVWGEVGTNRTPLFARWVGNVLTALYEKKLTLIDAQHLLDHMATQRRYKLTHDLKAKAVRQDWLFAATLTPERFESQVGSTINRLRRFIENETLKSVLGQPGESLDLGKALDEGSIILVSLATEKAKVSQSDAALFATLLLSDLWTAAQERGKRDGIKPFYCYLDEFQRFVTPTIADSLDEARGFGLHMTMAHQFPNQLSDRGEHGKRIYNSIMENASSKIVFRLSHSQNLKVMAEWLFTGVMNPEEVKHQLFATKVMKYDEETREVHSHGSGTSEGSGMSSGMTGGMSSGGMVEGGTHDDPNAWNRYSGESDGQSSTQTETEMDTVTTAPILVPKMGKELSHVQFRSLEEQLFRAMAVLFDQEERRAVTRTVGMKAPISIQTPTVLKMPGSAERTKNYLESCYKKLPFAMPGKVARERRATQDNPPDDVGDEPPRPTRKIK